MRRGPVVVDFSARGLVRVQQGIAEDVGLDPRKIRFNSIIVHPLDVSPAPGAAMKEPNPDIVSLGIDLFDNTRTDPWSAKFARGSFLLSGGPHWVM